MTLGGRLKVEPEDFVVIEQGGRPREADGPFTAAQVRLRNWETNRFVAVAAKRMRLRPADVAFSGMKDKRAVTTQWFTFRCPPGRLDGLAGLQDVELLEAHTTDRSLFAGAHDGNRFEIRVREAADDPTFIAATLARIQADGGVENAFGPQRFGGTVRPITAAVGRAIVLGDLKEAIRLFVGNPVEGERPETYEARRLYDETGDAGQALAAYPLALEPERRILERLVRRPEDWRHALRALPHNLLQLFIHALQSEAFNTILAARRAAGIPLTAVVGDRVMAAEDDGTKTVCVAAQNHARVANEIARRRASVTALLPGTDAPFAEGEPGRIERQVIAEMGVPPQAYRCRELPDVASPGRRRAILLPVADLQVEPGPEPVFRFTLGRGGYATTVLAAFMGEV